MNKKLSELIVGVVFVGGLVFLLSYTIILSGFRIGATKTYLVDFELVYGLKEGDAVRVEGYEKGKVLSLKLLPGGKIRAALLVADDVEIFKEGSDVRVTPFSPLGGRVVEIKRGDPLRGAYTFAGSAAGAVDVEEADVISGKAEGELLQTLNKLVDDNKESVRTIILNVEEVSNQLRRKGSGVLGYLINDEGGADKMDNVVARMSSAATRLDTIMTRVEEGEGILGGLLKDGTPLQRDVEGAVAGANDSLGSLSDILARADQGQSALGVLVSDETHNGVTGAMRGIVTDVKVVTGEVSGGRGSLGKLVHDDRLYDGAAGTAVNLESITGKIDEGDGLLGVLLEEETGDNARDTIKSLSSITAAIDDPEAGTLGLLVHDDALRGRLSRIAEEVERLVVEFRDSTEDLREQAPVNAFIGAVFAAF
jgi:phospholipid/cholesterol/gamma-HCH transport system substrate-binding protein